jgi:hypothetical protein
MNEECEFCGAPIVSVGYPDGSVEYECADDCQNEGEE